MWAGRPARLPRVQRSAGGAAEVREKRAMITNLGTQKNSGRVGKPGIERKGEGGGTRGRTRNGGGEQQKRRGGREEDEERGQGAMEGLGGLVDWGGSGEQRREVSRGEGRS